MKVAIGMRVHFVGVPGDNDVGEVLEVIPQGSTYTDHMRAQTAQEDLARVRWESGVTTIIPQRLIHLEEP